MQEGRAMGDGQFYNVRQYEKMADEFRTKWIEEHHEDPTKVTYRDLESDYWNLIKGVPGEAVQVQVAPQLNIGLLFVPTDIPLRSN